MSAKIPLAIMLLTTVLSCLILCTLDRSPAADASPRSLSRGIAILFVPSDR